MTETVMNRLLVALLLAICSLSAIAAGPRVVMQTTQGDITLELDADKAPTTVANFLEYVDSGFYDGTVFHRVIERFMIQGGGFDTDYQRKPTGEPISNEADNGLKNSRGTIAMARTSDPHSATAQFFINVSDNTFLDYPGQDGWGYAVFGRVVDGMDAVDSIATQPTEVRSAALPNLPREPVIIEHISRIDTEEKTH
jgi:peptidyl-prolyl cis-trans isomerase A (cyclophilin A)